jgi:hypothetical protein
VADFVKVTNAQSSQVIGPDARGTLYSAVDSNGDLMELVVTQGPAGWAVTATIGC